jgi:membrane protease YdiL (CAAX protease family)
LTGVEKKSLRLFLIITLAISAVLETVYIVLGEKAAGLTPFIMLVPAFAAIIVKIKYFKKQGVLGFNRCKPVYIVLSMLIPTLYLGLSYGGFWLYAKGSYSTDFSTLIELAKANIGNGFSDGVALMILMLIVLPQSFLAALGEEVGWRGFMFPTMQKLWGYKKALLVSGGIWACWHLPAIFFGLYLPGTSVVFAVPMFIVEMLAVTVIISWLRMRSNSIWPAAILHTAHNFLDQGVFQTMAKSDSSAYFTGETGIVTIGVTALIAAIILIKDKNWLTHEDAV